MKAVLRVWWTLFTAVRLQRVLCVIGGVLFALGAIGWPLSGNPASLPIGFLAFAVSAGTPALFSAPAIFRSLSAARTYQLLPHFRPRMLLAVSSLLGALLAAAFVFVLAEALVSGLSLSAIGYPLAALVALFLVLFLAFGDPRWFILVPIAAVVLTDLKGWSPAAWDMVAALPAWSWSAMALGVWLIFAVWYLRAPRVRGVMLTPQGRSGVEAAQPVSRTVALRVLLAPNAPRGTDRRISPRNAAFLLAVLLVFVVFITQSLRSMPLTSFVWPAVLTIVFAQGAVAVVRQSRLLWLRIPGSRDAVRAQIERALWRNVAMMCAWLVVVAAIAASPLVGHSAAEVALGFALLVGAAIYASYVALAAVTGIATYVWAFGSMALLHVALLWYWEVLSARSLTTVTVVAAVELAGAALLRALAVRRWRTVDWLRFRPLKSLVGVPRSL